MPENLLSTLLLPNTRLQSLESHLYTALPAAESGAPYDNKAAAYDRMVSSDLYLKLAWGASRSTIQRFMQDAFESSEGPVLDLAAGTSVDAVHVYPMTSRPTVVADLSLEMLKKGRTRLIQHAGRIPDNLVFLQADAFQLPFKQGAISTLLCHGAFHLLPDLPRFITESRRVLASEGGLYISSLVAERAFGNAYLKFLHRSGEVSPPMRADECRAILEAGMDRKVSIRTEGNFAYLVC